jgi:hypothetical protein
VAILAACGAAAAAASTAQELEPRAYSASPVGVNFVAGVLSRSAGDVVTDPTLPITDVSARIGSFAVGYGRTFDLFGRQALATAALPYAWGSAEGNVGEDRRKITRSGLADLRAKLSVNLYGNPAMSPQEFAKTSRGFLVGASLAISAPTGQYDPTRLVNLGTNRWALKPEVGVSVPVGRFDFDLYAGVVFFTENTSYYPGTSTRTQDPIGTVQLHGSYTFRPGLWVAVDSTWYGGGSARVNDGPPTTRLSNSRVGVTLSVPIGRRQSLKANYSTGASVRAGQDFNTFALAWQFLWF